MPQRSDSFSSFFTDPSFCQIYFQDRFARLAKENEHALTSEDKDAQMKRVPPSSLVSSTGNEWKTLSAEVKAEYEER